MATKSTIIFYVSGHGFGHATRSAAVMDELANICPSLKIHVRSQAPAFIFSGKAWKASWSRLPHDPVLVQRGAHEVDLEATYAGHKAFCFRWDEFVHAEAAFIDRLKPSVVAADVSPIGIAAAYRAGIPAVAVANFSWDWIIGHYARKDPRWKPVVATYRQAYSRACWVYRTPLFAPLSSFREVIDTPLIARRAVMPASLVRRKLGLQSRNPRLVLVTLGGLDNGSAPIVSSPLSPPPLSGRERVGGVGSYVFISPMKCPAVFQGRWITLPRNSPVPFIDLVAASDAVLSKPGYGIISECWAHRKPLLYVPGEGNPEIPVLVRWLRKLGGSCLMPRPDFLAGSWAEYLNALFSLKRSWPDVSANGAHFIARSLINKFYLL